jgi:hypothetical protein
MLLLLLLFTLLPHCQHRCHATANVSTPPLPPLPSVGVEVDACYTNADSSPATLLLIERKKKSGTKIHHGLRRPPNTNKNATTNQKHVGLLGKK